MSIKMRYRYYFRFCVIYTTIYSSQPIDNYCLLDNLSIFLALFSYHFTLSNHLSRSGFTALLVVKLFKKKRKA